MRPPKALRKEWYRKLREAGFVDAELPLLPDSPLKEYHSTHFLKVDVRARRASTEAYQQVAEHLLHSDQLADICKRVTARKNVVINGEQVMNVWQLHCTGLSERGIAKTIGMSKSTVNRVIRKLQDWMWYV